eukprot:gnl/MRDRNA2_/MRDRNA2_112660_c0_seq1.p1 gnl/MRDRNA2_/MRDRNA2_112660_c0~~gnl/MRDRNA2_/MRDRNA2_112660_c0_seq1.p1  ORF type:complete len:1148 (-),score=228.06 gnl/MRDRNA2_/MRDRNA2_112660_c0_seq1:96-3344(-)
MENPALREYWNLTASPEGIQVRSLEPSSPLLVEAKPPVQKNDVLMAIDDEPVFANGMMQYSGIKEHSVSLPFSVRISEKKLGEPTKLTFWRYSGPGGKNSEFDVSIVFRPMRPLVPRIEDADHVIGERPSYFIINGLVWTEFSEELSKQVEAGGTGIHIPDATHVEAFHRWRNNSDEQVVVLLRGLEHNCNKFYPMRSVQVLSLFNDEPVKNMTEFIKSVGKALKTKDTFLRFAFKPQENADVAGGIGDPDIVLDRRVCKDGATDGELLVKHNIMSPASPNLMETYLQSIPKEFLEALETEAKFELSRGVSQEVDDKKPQEDNSAVSDNTQGSSPGQDSGQNDIRSEGSSLLTLRSGLHTSRVTRSTRMVHIQGSNRLRSKRGFAETGVKHRDRYPHRNMVGFENVQPAHANRLLESEDKPQIGVALGRLTNAVEEALAVDVGTSKPLADADNQRRKSLGFLPSTKAADFVQNSDDMKAMHKADFLHQSKDKEAPVFQTSITEHDSIKGPKGVLPWTNVVKIRLVFSEQDFIYPWKKGAESGARCSGIIQDLNARRVMTNSHCVDSASALYLSREDHPNEVHARVVELAHDVDLAWITTLDGDAEGNSFWKNQGKAEPLKDVVKITEPLPELGAEVHVIGYPTGGDGITITQGIVSRIDGQHYPNGLLSTSRTSPERLPIVQVDAAINPGNSGGPAFDSAGNLLGLAFAGIERSQSIGYVIPNALIQNFIASASNKKYGWVAQPELGIAWRRIGNPGMQRFLGLKPTQTGVQVRSVAPLSALNETLQKGDIITMLDDRPVTAQGEIKFDVHDHILAMPLDVLISQKGKKEKTKFTFLRREQRGDVKEEKSMVQKTVSVSLRPVPPLVARFDDAPLMRSGDAKPFAATPTYFMFFGLIWGVFSVPMLHQAQGEDRIVPYSVQKHALHRWREKDEEVVVLLGGLEHSCNMYYQKNIQRVLQFFNKQEVKSMADLVKFTCEAALADEKYYRYTFLPLADEDAGPDPNDRGGDPDIVLKKEYCIDADMELLQQYNIPGQVSEDLQEVFAPYQKKMEERARERLEQIKSEQQAADKTIKPAEAKEKD